MEREFTKLASVSELLEFLSERGGKHQAYHHYTSISVLKLILKSGKWKLSNPETMNDLQERHEKGSEAYWQQSVFASFGYGESENMAMWGLYCFPREEAIRISIPRGLMKAWYAYTVKNQPEDTVLLSDIVYVSDPEAHERQLQMRWNHKKADITSIPSLINLSHQPEMTGLVKHEAWSYENEVRFLLRLKKPNKDGIFVNLPEGYQQQIRVRLGPWMNQEAKHSAILQLGELGVLADNISESIFSGKVHLENKCDSCDYYLKAESMRVKTQND